MSIMKKKVYPKTCTACGYKWDARIEHPKSCPRCKYRFDSKLATKIRKERR